MFTKDNAKTLGAKGGRQSKKRDMLTQQIIAELQAVDGEGVSKARRLVMALIDKAIDGDVAAVREVLDRVEGKVTQIIGGDEDNPLEFVLHGLGQSVDAKLDRLMAAKQASLEPLN